MYKNGRTTAAIEAGRARSRRTNQTVPFVPVVGRTLDASGSDRELLACGHLGGYLHIYVADLPPVLAARRRCKRCAEAR